jgi:hypothetical protein
MNVSFLNFSKINSELGKRRLIPEDNIFRKKVKEKVS